MDEKTLFLDKGKKYPSTDLPEILFQVVMSDSGVFEVHGVAHDLGLEELCQHCEDHIATTMTPHNACTFLMAALKMEQRTGGQFYL